MTAVRGELPSIGDRYRNIALGSGAARGAGQFVRRTDEIGDETRVRRAVQVERAAELLDDAAMHQADLIRDDERFFLVVRDVNRGQPAALLQLADFVAHLGAQL